MPGGASKTLITGEIAKLPPEVRAYFDPDQHLPASVQFFEERLTTGAIARRAALGVGLALGGLALIVLGVFFVVLPVIGLVLLFVGGWVLLATRASLRARNRQATGKQTRLGIFLFDETFAQNNEFGYTLIPRQNFRGIENFRVTYTVNDELKSFDLPQALVGTDRQALCDAITAWSNAR